MLRNPLYNVTFAGLNFFSYKIILYADNIITGYQYA
jgi:hypothetical protein